MSIRQTATDAARTRLNTPMKRLSLAAIVLTGLLVGAYLSHTEPLPAPHTPEPILQGQQLHYPADHPQLALLLSTPALAAHSVMVELPARLVWNEERTQRIYPAFAGRVQQLLADVGQSVTPGQVLATLASPDFGAAQADTAKALAEALVAEQAHARLRTLYEADAVAKKDVELAAANWQRAKAEAERAQGITAMYGSQGAVNQQWSLRANMHGVVVERNLSPGLEVRPEQSGPGMPALLVVSDPTSLWVQIDAREADVGALRKGVPIQLRLPSFPDEVFKATLSTSSDFIDPSTRTIKARAVLHNPERRLKAEMLGTAILERRLPAGVLVPASAVLLDGKAHRVFVQTQTGVFEPRQVTLGYEGPHEVLLLNGVNEGERVVKDNSLLLAREYRIAKDEAKAHNAQTQPGP